MNQKELSDFEKILSKCNRDLSKQEPWPSYYLRRYAEFRSYFNLLPRKKFKNALEIGCGIGYQSILISSFSENVVATDLLDKGSKTHSMGLQKAQDFLTAYGSSTIRIEPANAEALPYPDERFDFVYSSFAFHYADDQKKALKEIARVMEKDGLFLCILPTSAMKVYSLIDYYPNMLRLVLYRFFSSAKPVTAPAAKTSAGPDVTQENKSRWMKYILPPPDKEGDSFMSEFRTRTPGKWHKLFSEEKQFEIVCAQTTMLTPVSLFGVFSPKLASYIYSKAWRLDSFLGKFAFFKNLGYNLVIIAKKR